uniref:cDNA clone:J013001F04, full insert sequence n=2 Tax=Oryza TaxID=4527 RepID=B7EAC7_ORYSJ|nr:unnamed protein product [Oryza sativa Japonica Group]
MDPCSPCSGTRSRACKKRTPAWTSTSRTGSGWINPSTSGLSTSTMRATERIWSQGKLRSRRNSVVKCRSKKLDYICICQWGHLFDSRQFSSILCRICLPCSNSFVCFICVAKLENCVKFHWEVDTSSAATSRPGHNL